MPNAPTKMQFPAASESPALFCTVLRSRLVDIQRRNRIRLRWLLPHDPDAEAAALAVSAVQSRDLTVTSVTSKPASRNPWPPFMTSTLQQEASRKFGMGAKQCMNAAQRLYEAGHITYMRTDGIDMAPEAVTLEAGLELIAAKAAKGRTASVSRTPRTWCGGWCRSTATS